MEAACELAKARVCAKLEDGNTKGSLLLSPLVEQKQRKKINTVIRESSKPNTESTLKQRHSRRQTRPRNTLYVNSDQCDLPAQDDSCFQDSLIRPSQEASARKKVDDNKDTNGRGDRYNCGQDRDRDHD